MRSKQLFPLVVGATVLALAACTSDPTSGQALPGPVGYITVSATPVTVTPAPVTVTDMNMSTVTQTETRTETETSVSTATRTVTVAPKPSSSSPPVSWTPLTIGGVKINFMKGTTVVTRGTKTSAVLIIPTYEGLRLDINVVADNTRTAMTAAECAKTADKWYGTIKHPALSTKTDPMYYRTPAGIAGSITLAKIFNSPVSQQKYCVKYYYNATDQQLSLFSIVADAQGGWAEYEFYVPLTADGDITPAAQDAMNFAFAQTSFNLSDALDALH